MFTGAQLRDSFIRYFVERGHTHVASSSLLPHNDRTLLFTNAGMVPFKDVFVGVEQRPYTRAVSSQKCLRLSGKHNDLENVGQTARHNTFFEMLGNFSFGDYFKQEAIDYAWDFLTRGVGLDPARLWVSVFEGDAEVPADEEAARYWQDAGVPPERILRFGRKDNFWQMGETGPCGPCSEIHYYRGESPADPAFNRADLVNGPGDTTMEIWNNVFMQFERFPDGSLKPLPKPSVDTGMGLERLTMVVQGVGSNFETDLMFPLVELAQELTGKGYGEREQDDISMRVLADHARAVAFLLGEGLLPSNVGQGYSLRQLLRRALRHGRLLGLDKPFFTRFTDKVADMFGEVYSELRANRQRVARIVLGEEERFAKALDKGLEVLGGIVAEVKARGESVIPGERAFLLYDTFGFPLDLTLETAKDHGLGVDEAGYRAEMERQKATARESWTGGANIDPVLREAVASLPATQFLGYDSDEADATVLALIADGQAAEALEAGQSGEAVLDQSPFYAEAGGQIGDAGSFEWEGGEARVLGTRGRIPGYAFHQVEIRRGTLRAGMRLRATVEAALRNRTRLNHTATHLLHAALREVLGDHVKQAGSYVGPDRLRFDFTHFAALDANEKQQIEELTNRKIRENIDVATEVMDLDAAMQSGAMALFGEKYAGRVRVLRIGDFSTELCGGTHARRSGDIGLFKIVSEESIKAGVRRIEALTGPAAVELVQKEHDLLQELTRLLNTTPEALPERVEAVVRQLRHSDKELERLKTKLASGAAGSSEKIVQVAGVPVLARKVEELGDSSLSNLADELKAQIKSGVVVLVNRHPDRVALRVAVTKDLTGRLNAVDIVRAAAAPVGGKGGGGRPEFAQAGGKEPEGIDAAIEAAIEKVRAALA
jgi:alanyl-tRNA synthetase